jgi:hypothetical protein
MPRSRREGSSTLAIRPHTHGSKAWQEKLDQAETRQHGRVSGSVALCSRVRRLYEALEGQLKKDLN